MSIIGNNNSIELIICTAEWEIIYKECIEYISSIQSAYEVRKVLIKRIDELLLKYSFDTIFVEKTKIFTDGITIYPDPLVYKNIVYRYSFQVCLEDNYLDKMKYFLEIPYKEWTQTILNTKQKYLFNKCKEHILEQKKLNENETKELDTLNWYQALCFSNSIKYSSLMNDKFLV